MSTPTTASTTHSDFSSESTSTSETSSVDIAEISLSSLEIPDQLTPDQLSALEIHNVARSEVNVPPLSWSPVLAQGAQVWAEHLAGHNLGHRRGRLRMRDVGTNDNITFAHRIPPLPDPLSAAARRILREKAQWPCPHAARDGKITRECGQRCSDLHMQWTQMVWKDTTHVGMGCSMNPSTGHQYVVVRFWPGGNVVGEAPY